MSETTSLVEEYRRTGSQTAFRELVDRYVDLVYSTALRRVGGDAHLAEDVVQTVFCRLARRVQEFSGDVFLGGWLHRDTCHVAATVVRGERRRLARERQAVEMNALHQGSGGNWEEVAPLLDEAIGRLNAKDRQAILLRFYERHDFDAVGVALGTTEDAARMRVNRALEKLHALLRRRGVAFPAAAFGSALAAHAVVAAPVGLAASAAAGAWVGVAAGTGMSGALGYLMTTMTKLKVGVLGATFLAGMGVPLALSHRPAPTERAQAAAREVERLTAENERLANLLAQATNQAAAAAERSQELVRLRGQVGDLRRQLDRRAAVPTVVAPGAGGQDAEAEAESEAAARERQSAIAKMTFAKNWMVALLTAAGNNDGQLSRDPNEILAKASQNLPAEERAGFEEAMKQFELTFQGRLDELTNPPPGQTIVLREKEAWPTVRGKWARTYGFADGHSEVHSEDHGDFTAWEQSRTPQAPH